MTYKNKKTSTNRLFTNSKMLKRFIFIGYFLCWTTFVFCQHTFFVSEQLEWSETQVQSLQTNNSTNSSKMPTVICDKCEFDLDNPNTSSENLRLPIYSKKIAIPFAGKISAKIHNVKYDLAQNANFSDLSTIKNQLEPNIEIGFSQRKPFAYLNLTPLIKDETGQVQLLTAFEIEITIQPQTSGANNNNNAFKTTETTTNSVLNQGTFYKFRVQDEGIHKIDYDFIQSLDISVADIALSDIRVYGNGGGMLPERVGDTRQDDLLENSIEVFDQNNNNLFDDGDYVLFFAESPDQWYLKENGNIAYFEHKKHLYSDYNHYFINFDLGPGKRIENSTFSGTPNYTSTSFDDMLFHEEEVYNVMGSGREWFGDLMTNGDEKTFPFNFPNLIQEENTTRLSTRVAGFSHYGTSTIRLSVGNDVLKTFSLGLVGQSLESPGGKADNGIHFLSDNGDNIEVKFQYTNPSTDGKGWIGHIALNARRQLNLSASALRNGQQVFRDKQSVEADQITRFEIQNVANNLQIWDVSNLGEVQRIQLENNGFVTPTTILRKFIAFDQTNFFTPEPIGKIEQQNLHADEMPDYLMIVHPNLKSQAERLAEFHRNENGYNVKIANVFDIYNEFSSGNQDITAIRDYAKMYYDRASGSQDGLKYLLLFGDASYDFKNLSLTEEENSNMVPTYESYNPFSKTLSYCTDDYFAMLDDGEGYSDGSNEGIDKASFGLDIAIGRFPVKSELEAAAMVDKILHYKSDVSKGEWWNTITFVGDDGNGNLHLKHGENHTNILKSYPTYNIDKYYLDAFPQVPGPNGDAYPDVNKALLDRLFSGTLIMNYIGHGSEKSWSKEGVMTEDIIRTLENKDKLPLFITATCTFSRFDDPHDVTAGEWLLLNPDGGAVSIVSTVRVVGAYGNEQINKAFLENAFVPYNGAMPTLGEITILAKNSLTSNAANFRKFALLGDPGLKLNYPDFNVQTTSITNEKIGSSNDTIQALSKVKITGVVTNQTGNTLTDFNGTVTPVIYDKMITLTTIGNDLSDGYDPETGSCPTSGGDADEISCPIDFELQQNVIFKGNVSVVDGAFDFTFVVPKDISYNYGNGKITYFAFNEQATAAGFDTTLVIGGISDLAGTDNEGPAVELFLNDENFVFGGLTNDTPILLVNLQDENGINTVGTGIGHDIIAKLDEDSKIPESYTLNNYYETVLDDFTQGKIQYPLDKLTPGLHNIRVKAWDVFNNSGEGYTEFLVAESAELALQNVLNYPNPFSDNTNFWFEHNRPGENLKVRVQIFTLSGKVIKTIQQDIVATGTRNTDLSWNGLDDFGNQIGRGVYVYQVSVTTADNNTVTETQRLVLLK